MSDVVDVPLAIQPGLHAKLAALGAQCDLTAEQMGSAVLVISMTMGDLAIQDLQEQLAAANARADAEKKRANELQARIDEAEKQETITYLLRAPGCIAGMTESSFDVALSKALNMPAGTAIIPLYEHPTSSTAWIELQARVKELESNLSEENKKWELAWDSLNDKNITLERQLAEVEAERDAALSREINLDATVAARDARIRELEAALRGISDGSARITKKADQCTHGRYGYEECENCLMDYAEHALSPAPADTAKG